MLSTLLGLNLFCFGDLGTSSTPQFYLTFLHHHLNASHGSIDFGYFVIFTNFFGQSVGFMGI
jgi:hypothetical protein